VAGAAAMAGTSVGDAFTCSVTLLLDNVALSTYQVLIEPRIVSVLFHLLGFHWHTCRVAVGAGVASSLEHVPCGMTTQYPTCLFLLDHVSQCCMSACQFLSEPHVVP
jgi:hypothetical protein